MEYEDIRYEVDGPSAIITIARPKRLNAFRGRTVEELIDAFHRAWTDSQVACVIFTGEGERAFCVGGDQKEYVEKGSYGTSANGLFEIDTLHNVIRDTPKPVIAAVNGLAIGGGHVLHVVCDVTIASETARFGQAGPRVGSFDAGYGTSFLSRIVGEKRAREIWFFCRQYDARQAEAWGLVNKVVPAEQLLDEARAWGREAAALSPTALKFLKASFNADSVQAYGQGKLAFTGLETFGKTDEAVEGRTAFAEKRDPDFSPYREADMITDFDDFMVHQTSDPIGTPSASDRNFYDRYWFNGFDREGDFLFEIGFALYPNRHVMDGHFSVSKDGVQHAFHASRRAPKERSEMSIGPLRIEVTTPMREVRVVLEANETGIECDLVFQACTTPTQEPKNVMHDDGRLIMNTSRFTQLGSWGGHFGVAGRRTEVVRASTLGTRDKSWGVRPVGEPESGAPGLLTTEPGVYWVWSPIFFDGYCTQFGTFEDRDGNATQVSGTIVPTYASMDEIPRGEDPGRSEMATARHRIEWTPGTRLAAGAELELTSPAGETLCITLEPMIRFQMLALGYQHPEWGHGFWKGEEVFAAEAWQLDAIDLLDYKHIHNHQICRARLGDQTGVGTLETVVFGRHDPSGFKTILDGAP